MLNLRNRHMLSLRTRFAAAASCRRVMRMARRIVPALAGAALTGVSTDDPGGGPGG